MGLSGYVHVIYQIYKYQYNCYLANMVLYDRYNMLFILINPVTGTFP